MISFGKAVQRAAQMPPGKMDELLRKLRKQADAGITLAQVLAIVESLGGSWEFEPAYAPRHYWHDGKIRPVTEGYLERSCSEEQLRERHAHHEAIAVPSLPDEPDHLGEVVISEVGEIEQGGYGLYYRHLEWVAVNGLKVTMPGGEEALLLPSHHDLKEHPLESFMDGLKRYEGIGR
jgi:hypothetical protein